MHSDAVCVTPRVHMQNGKPKDEKAKPAPRQSLNEQVFAQLASDILSRKRQAGEHLPPERALAQQLGVNRQVVREATKRLSQLGLVKIAQGDGTRVLDYMETAGPDLLSLMAKLPQATLAGGTLLRSVAELRSAIAIDLARLCAMRATPALSVQLVRTAEAMRDATGDEAKFDLDVAFWDLLHKGADNIAYRLLYNPLKQGALSIRAQILPWQLFEIRAAEYRLPLALAIASGDAIKAEARARHDFHAGLAMLLPLLGGSSGSVPPVAPEPSASRQRKPAQKKARKTAAAKIATSASLSRTGNRALGGPKKPAR
jgi:GntR family transcriptional repressor for pyruvate dehydrogenase complex